MLLYLLRHADASPYQADDFSRHLTEKGVTQAKQVGKFLADHGIKSDLILTSPLLRAKESAEIVAKKLGGVDLTQASWLTCGMRPEVALSELAAYSRFDSVMIVGHEPDFSSLIASLIGLKSGDAIDVSKASLTAIEISRFTKGNGVLRFFLPVKIL